MANEKRTIEANALKKYIFGIADMHNTDYLFVDMVVDAIDNAPTVEVVHARWEDEYDGKYSNPRYRCSACKERALYKFERDLLDNWKEVQALTPNCPHCGARMDGENK